MTTITVNLPDALAEKLKAIPNLDEYATHVLTQALMFRKSEAPITPDEVKSSDTEDDEVPDTVDMISAFLS
jgi:hypothetical protein